MILRRSLVCLLAATALGALSSPVAAKTFTQRLKFARGRSSATVEGAVVRGDRDDWIIGARKGQRLIIRVTALEKNAEFQLLDRASGRYLKGAGEMDDATRWTGRLPRTGDYLIRVGGTRGNATYKLHVSIR